MSLVNELGEGLDGLGKLQALIASGRKPGILVSLDFEFVEVGPGKAVFAGTPGEHAYNPIGSVHGGYAAALLDSAHLSPLDAVEHLLATVQRWAKSQDDDLTVLICDFIASPNLAVAD